MANPYAWNTGKDEENGDSDGDLNWAEGQAPSTVNDSSRAQLASHARLYKAMYGGITSTGASGVYALETQLENPGLTLAAGVQVGFKANHDSPPTGATLNVDSTGAKLIVTMAGDALGTKTIVTDGIYKFLYDPSGDGGSGVWKIQAQSTTTAGVVSINGGPVQGRVNEIINGNFDNWQRETSQTTSGYGSDDRFSNLHSISTKTNEQQAHILGQTAVPGEPEYFCRTTFVTGGTSASYVTKNHRIEGVRKLAGKLATLTLYLDVDVAKDIAIEIRQDFGTGGSPAPSVSVLVETLSLVPGFNKYTLTVNMPSISGKTLGTDGNDFVEIIQWYDAGSNYDAMTNSLGNQSGTVDVSRMSFVKGDATLEDDAYIYQTPKDKDLSACQRYCEIAGLGTIGVGAGAAQIYAAGTWKVSKRASTSLSMTTSSPSFHNGSASFTGSGSTINDSGGGSTGFYARITGFIGVTAGAAYYNRSGDFLLGDSEL